MATEFIHFTLCCHTKMQSTFDISQHKPDFQIAVHVSSVLSLLGSASVVFSYLFVGRFKSKTNRLVFFLSLSNFLGALHLFFGTWALDVIQSQDFCTYQGYAIQYFLLSSFFWTACLALQSLISVIQRKPAHSQFEKFYHLISWGIPALLTAGLVFYAKFVAQDNIMADAGLFCWISPNYSSMQTAFFFGPLWAVMAFLVSVCLVTGFAMLQSLKVKLNSEEEATSKPTFNNLHYSKNIILYLAAFLFVWLWPTANRIDALLDPTHPILALLWLVAIFLPLQGFLQAAVYFWLSFRKGSIQITEDLDTPKSTLSQKQSLKSNITMAESRKSTFSMAQSDSPIMSPFHTPNASTENLTSIGENTADLTNMYSPSDVYYRNSNLSFLTQEMIIPNTSNQEDDKKSLVSPLMALLDKHEKHVKNKLTIKTQNLQN